MLSALKKNYTFDILKSFVRVFFARVVQEIRSDSARLALIELIFKFPFARCCVEWQGNRNFNQVLCKFFFENSG